MLIVQIDLPNLILPKMLFLSKLAILPKHQISQYFLTQWCDNVLCCPKPGLSFDTILVWYHKISQNLSRLQ